MHPPRYPVYVISRGRSDRCLTAQFLQADGIPFSLVIEPQEAAAYASVVAADQLLVLPFSNLGQGSIPARNWVFEHAKSQGHTRHWILDDNIARIWRYYKGKRVPCDAGPALRAIEDFADRYENVAIAGMNYEKFIGWYKSPAYLLNVHIYSCLLIDNALPQRWRGRYNEDTDICLQVLAAGYCTVLFNVFLIQKIATMTMKGGNTDELYQGDGRLHMARSLERVWPHVATTKRRFHRPQHVIRGAWRGFDTPLIRRADIDWEALAEPNEYGMKLTQVADEIKSPRIQKLLDEAGGSRLTDNPSMPFLQSTTEQHLTLFLECCAQIPGLDVALVERSARQALRYYASNGAEHEAFRPYQVIEEQWYASLEAGTPDFSVYDGEWCVGDTFACFAVYSSKYLKALAGPKGAPFLAALGTPRCVVDVGCGVGFATAGLRTLFPTARVIGTNRPSSLQWHLNTVLAERFDFEVLPDAAAANQTADLIFASEYFEHFEAPVDHLREVLAAAHPRALIVANAFGSRSVGHFPNYTIDGAVIPGKEVGRHFNQALRTAGYQAQRLGFWNNRPACWLKA